MTEQTTAVATQRAASPLATLISKVKQREQEFRVALPSHVPSDRFMRVMLSAISTTKDIAQCSPKSVLTECMKAAQDGLVIDGREAALVKFGSDAKYIPMVAGLMKMARNSGDISTISAVLVYEKDAFSYNPGIDDVPNHSPDWFGDRGAAVGVYSVVRLKDGAVIVEVMSKAQILKIASATKNANQYDPGKGASWGEWWRKCVLRRISKYLPRSSDKDSPEFIDAVRRDDDLYDAETGEVEVPAHTRRARKKAGAAQDALNAAPKPQDNAEEIPSFLDRRNEAVDAEYEDQGAEQGEDADVI